jgi:hypothetical protein
MMQQVTRVFSTFPVALDWARSMIPGALAPLRVDGDFGQDEGRGEVGLGNDDVSFVIRADGYVAVTLDEYVF